MKVTRNHPDQLILENRPWFLALTLGGMMLIFVAVGLGLTFNGDWFGMFFVVMGLIVPGILFAFMVRRTMVILDRSTGTIELRRKSVMGMKNEEYPLSDLKAARIATNFDVEGDTHRCELEMAQGKPIPLTIVYTNGSGPWRAADAINGWLGVG